MLTDSEEQWNRIINSEVSIEEYPEYSNRIHIRVCGEIVIDQYSGTSNAIEFIVATYDNTIKITIDASGNHARAHIHIGIKKDKYHSASIAINDGELLNNTGNIPDWKIKKIMDWIHDNKPILQKMYRCINPWGQSHDAERRKNRLTNL